MPLKHMLWNAQWFIHTEKFNFFLSSQLELSSNLHEIYKHTTLLQAAKQVE